MEQRDQGATPEEPAPSKQGRRNRFPLLAAGMAVLAGAVVAAVMLLGGKSHSEHITQQGYSAGPWPFTVAAVDIKCVDGSKELINISGTDFALNDDARSAGYAQNFGSFWIDDPSTPGAKLPIFQLIMKAQDLC